MVLVQDGLDAKVLAEELLALESQFRTSTMNPMGGTKMSGDWTVTIDGGSGRWGPSSHLYLAIQSFYQTHVRP